MSKRFIISKKNYDSINHNLKFRNCAHHDTSHNYSTHTRYHNDIVDRHRLAINNVEMRKTLLVKTIFHIIGPTGTFNPERTKIRADEIISSINSDFNNYSINSNTLNNVRYRNIINQVFSSNLIKKNIYLSDDYLNLLPTEPSGIVFELGQIYYYPVRNRLNLTQYDHIGHIDLEHQEIKRYIGENGAVSIYPDNYLNIWILDTIGTPILGFSSFPWELIDEYNGIVINRRAFFPEDYNEVNYNLFKIFTHEIGHYLGLLHIFNNDNIITTTNINTTARNSLNVVRNNNVIYDPLNRLNHPTLLSDNQYNPLFTNFMGYTFDKYMSIFTLEQIQRMRYMLYNYRPRLISPNKQPLPVPAYDPYTRTFNNTESTLANRIAPSVPSRESVGDTRLTANRLTQNLTYPSAITRTNLPFTNIPNRNQNTDLFPSTNLIPNNVLYKNYGNMCNYNTNCIYENNLSGSSNATQTLPRHALGGIPTTPSQTMMSGINIGMDANINGCISIDTCINDPSTYFSDYGYAKYFTCDSSCDQNCQHRKNHCNNRWEDQYTYNHHSMPHTNPHLPSYEEWKANIFKDATENVSDDSSCDVINDKLSNISQCLENENNTNTEDLTNVIEESESDEYCVNEQLTDSHSNVHSFEHDKIEENIIIDKPLINYRKNTITSFPNNVRNRNNMKNRRIHGAKKFIRTKPMDIVM